MYRAEVFGNALSGLPCRHTNRQRNLAHTQDTNRPKTFLLSSLHGEGVSYRFNGHALTMHSCRHTTARCNTWQGGPKWIYLANQVCSTVRSYFTSNRSTSLRDRIHHASTGLPLWLCFPLGIHRALYICPSFQV